MNHPADLWFVFEDFGHFFGYVFEFGFVKLYVGQQTNDVCLDGLSVAEALVQK